jgi:hypothetical protein
MRVLHEIEDKILRFGFMTLKLLKFAIALTRRVAQSLSVSLRSGQQLDEAER